MESIPVTITVSRETGQIVEVQRDKVKEEAFRKICQALTRREGIHGVSCGAGNRDGSGNTCNGYCE